VSEGVATAFGLEGSTAVISGAGSDIGAAIACAFARQGANVVLGDIDEARLAAAADRVGPEAARLVTDVAQRDALDALVDLATTRFGRVDVMANIAGVIFDRSVLDTTEEELDRLLAVNLKGVFFGCQAAGRVMSGQGAGSIINMASLAAFGSNPLLASYSMSKAAVVSLTRVLAGELGPAGVRVNAVAPGYVEGGMTTRNARLPDGSVDDEKMEPLRQAVARRTPLRRRGEPEDIAAAFVYLASRASRHMTGQVLHVNGGSYMP